MSLQSLHGQELMTLLPALRYKCPEMRKKDCCFAGAEMANVANEGALECGRRGGRLISKKDIYNGIDRILQVSCWL